uniref:Uncharacterized protein n=1 Tax=Aegilops tauschii subsp. strangulata TaxID=200361 RepID=A0A453P7W0_AEGTS
MYTIYRISCVFKDWSSPVLMVLPMLLLPLENHRAEPPVRGEFAVRELQVGHRRRVVPTVQPPSDRLCFVREPVCRDVRIIHHLLEDRADEVGRRGSLVRQSRRGSERRPPGGQRGGLHQGLDHGPHLPGEVRAAPPAHLGAPQAEVRELVGLHERPGPRGGVEDGVQLTLLHRVLHHLGDLLGPPARQELQDDDAQGVDVGAWRQLAGRQELRVHVCEGPPRGGRPVQRGGGGGGAGLRQEAADAEVPQLAHQVGVQEDVGRLQVPVDHRVRLVRVQERQGRAHLVDDPGAHLPCQRRRVVRAREPVLEAAVREVLVHQAERLPARPDQRNEVRVPYSAEDSNLPWR